MNNIPMHRSQTPGPKDLVLDVDMLVYVKAETE